MGRVRLLLVFVVLVGLLAPQASPAVAGEAEFFVRVTTPLYHLGPEGISVQGYALNQQPGAPALPLYGTAIELPPTGDWTIDVAAPGSRTLAERVSVNPARTPVVQGLGTRSADPLAESSGIRTVDLPDSAIYGRDAFYPQSVAVAGDVQLQGGKRLLPLAVYPFQYNPVTHEVVYHPEIIVTVRVFVTQASAGAVGVPPESVAATTASELGALWVQTGQRGMHRLNYSDVSKLGLPMETLKPDNFLMTYLGQPVQIQVTGAGDGTFDPPNPNTPGDPGDLVIFYAQPYVGRWTATNVYRFSYGTDPAPASTRMTRRTVTKTGSEPLVTTVNQVQHIEFNRQYIGDFVIPTEADHIFDATITVDKASALTTKTVSYDLTLDDPAMSGDMTISGLLYGGESDPPTPQWVKVLLNNHELGAYGWNGHTPLTLPPVVEPMTWLDGSPNQLKLYLDVAQVPSVSKFSVVPDWLEVSYPAFADAEANRMEIQDFAVTTTSVHFDVTGFSSATVKAYDVRDPRNPVQLLTTDHSTAVFSFWDAWAAGAAKPAYSLTTDGALLAPASLTVDEPSNWKSADHTADYIAIVHRSLWDAIQPLLDRRIAQGIKVAKVDVQDIYDEFNYGRPDQNAIRDFLEYAYQNWNQGGAPPKYVLLVGDATPDYKKELSSTLQNLVPGFLINIDPWMVETAADNRFVTFDGPDDVLPEMTIGRIPAQTPVDVTNYVRKVASYEDKALAPGGDWQNQVVYVADDDENSAGNFKKLSDNVRATLAAPYQSNTVYYNPNNNPPGGYHSPTDMKTNIAKSFNDSAIFLQWFGHASKFRWGSVSMWNILDVPNLVTNTKLPFVAAFSCLEGYFINLVSNYQTQAETHLLQAGRGSIGGLSPSGKHVGSALTILDQGLTNALFKDHIGVIGDATDAAKRYYFSNSRDGNGKLVYPDVIDTSILFGDPVLRLRLPVPLSVPDAPVVSVARSGNTNAVLSWEHVGSDAAYYEVYRSTEPYPTIGQALTNRIKDVSAGAYGIPYTFDWIDQGMDEYPADGTVGPVQPVGDAGNNYFWVVQSRSSSAQTSGYWNIVGEFDFALVKGN